MAYLLYLAGGLSGVVLLVVPFFSPLSLAPRWVRQAFWILGLLAVVWGLLAYTEHYSHYPFSALGRQRLFQCKTLCAGAASGVLVLLLISGELIRAFSRPRSAA